MLQMGRGQENTLRVASTVSPAFRVAIVGHDSLTVGLLADALARDLKCDAVGVRPPNLLRTLKTSSVDLVIISVDIESTPRGGFDLGSSVSSAHPEVSIIFLLDQPTKKDVANAFRCGARGVFNRQESMAEFLDCVEHVRKGFIWAAREEANFFLETFRNISASCTVAEESLLTLTPRQLQVVQCAARGRSNKAIASELGLSEHTIKNYLFKAFERLGISSRIELLFYLSTHGYSGGSLSRAEEEVP